MYRDGHIGINALAYSPVAFLLIEWYRADLALLGTVVVIGLASLPDIDRHFDGGMNTHRTDLLTYVPISHRGATHTVWFATLVGASIGVLLYGIVHPLNAEYTVFIVGFILGFLAIAGHIIGDVMTPKGVKPFIPVTDNRYSLALFKASNTYANKGLFIIGGIAITVIFLYGFVSLGEQGLPLGR